MLWRYLAEHQLEEVIADAMREVGLYRLGHAVVSVVRDSKHLCRFEVIHEKPTEPLAFLSTQILKHATTSVRTNPKP